MLQWLDELIMEVPLEQHAAAAAAVGAAAAAAAAGGGGASPPPAPGGSGGGWRLGSGAGRGVDAGRGMGRSSGDGGLVVEEGRRAGVAEGVKVRGGAERWSTGAVASGVLPPFIAIDM